MESLGFLQGFVQRGNLLTRALARLSFLEGPRGREFFGDLGSTLRARKMMECAFGCSTLRPSSSGRAQREPGDPTLRQRGARNHCGIYAC